MLSIRVTALIIALASLGVASSAFAEKNTTSGKINVSANKQLCADLKIFF